MAKRKRYMFQTSFNSYEDVAIVGEGGSGRVFKVVDEEGNQYAIKLLDIDRATREKLKRFKNEIVFCERAQHPNIIKVVDHGLIDIEGMAAPFYVMPYYETSLRTLIKEGIPPDKILPILSQVLDGVEAAHLQGVVHRDLKPENILYDKTEDLIIVADFGIARFTADLIYTAVETRDGTRLANFQYASPEQRCRGRLVDHRADIFALGLILNEMFTGEVPQGTEYKQIEADVPEYAYLDGLVANMLRQMPEERPADIRSIKSELIGRKNEFVAQQKFDEIRKVVVPESELNDPLILDPPRLVGVDWENGALRLKLSQKVNPKWVWALQNMGSFSAVLGKGPEAFQFYDDAAVVAAQENEVQRIIDYFKQWLPMANRKYERTIRQEMEEEQQKERARLQAEVAAREQRDRILRNMKT